MIYDIKINGTSIWNQQPSYRLISPVVDIELNTAGRLQFTMPPNHPYFDLIVPMADTAEVYENGVLIWFGRPTELERDSKNYKSCYCEGALAYFNDSVQRPRAAANTTAAALLASIVQTHNAQVPAGRQFTVGTVSMPSTEFGWENDYEQSLAAITEMLNRAGGFLIPRRENGVNYLDYKSTLPASNAQPVEFGLNMLTFDRRYSLADIATAILPLGGTPAGETSPVTIESVNSGSDILQGNSTALTTYGQIVKLMRWDKITDPTALKSKAQEWLNTVQFDPITINISAAELSFLSQQYGPFRIGTTVHAESTPHWLDRDLPITRMSIPMDRAAKEITLGTITSKTLTEDYSSTEAAVAEVQQTGGGGSGGDMRHWVGTEAEYQEITHDAQTVYFITTRSDAPVHYFSVSFVNGDEVLQTIQNVPETGNAYYTGPTPTKSGGYVFTGWSPYPYNVQADMICEAQFEIESIDPDEIQDDWYTICADKGASYNIGDKKTLRIGTVNGTNYGRIRIQKVAGSGYGVTSKWVALDILPINRRMTSTNNNDGGWAASELRQWLNTTFISVLPDPVRTSIVPTVNYSFSRDASIQSYIPNSETQDLIWIPSYQEVFGGTSYETQGQQFSVNLIGVGTEWWLRTISTESNRWIAVLSSGSLEYASPANNSLQIVIGFGF